MSVAAIRITHADGTTTSYDAASDSDTARGTALLAACAAAVAGDTISDVSAAHTFDVVDEQISPPAGTTAAPIVFQGAGKTVTTIYSQRHIDGSDLCTACIKPKSNQEWRDFTLHANNATVQQSPFGHGFNDFEAGDYTNVLLSDARIIAAVDCVHMTQAEVVFQVRCVRCEFHASFDCIAIANASSGGSSLELIDCTTFVQYPHPTYPYPSYSQQIGTTTRGLTTLDANCTLTVHGGSYTTAGGASDGNDAVRRILAGTPKLYNCTLSSAGTSALDINGNATVGNDVVYDTEKTSGTITVEEAWAPAPPTDLVVRAAGPGTVALAWKRNSTNETGFTVQRATNAAFTQGTGSVTFGAGVIGGSVSGLTAGTLYYFRVFATNATGNSTNSNRAKLTAPSNWQVAESAREARAVRVSRI
jgi:hypothetical protein